jgi:carbon monoxide dehydrogenase subunit G
MKLEQSFEVAAPVERVWQALIDVEQVAPCLPGAAVTGRNDDGSYNGTFTVKIGPTTASYTGKLEMESVDEASHVATMSAQGSDKRGQGGATAKIVSKLESLDDGRTKVEVDTDYHITGRLARFGRGGMIEDISERLLKEFASRLAQSLEGPGEDGATVELAAAPSQQTEERPGEGAEAEAPAPTDAPEPPPTDAPAPAPTDAPVPPPTDAAKAPPAESAPPRPASPPPNEPMDAGSLVGGVLLDRVKANPWPWIGGALLVLLLRRRRRG